MATRTDAARIPRPELEHLIVDLEQRKAALQKEIDRLMAILLTYPTVSAAPAPFNLNLSSSFVDPSPPSNAVVGQLSFQGGDGTSNWVILDNANFSLSSATAAVPNLIQLSAGSFTPGVAQTVTVQITDASHPPLARAFNVTVDTVPSDITYETPPATIATTAPAGTLIAVPGTVGGRGPYTYSITDDTKYTVTAGLVVRSATGTLVAGADAMTVRTTDVWGNTHDEVLNITVQDPATGVQVTDFTVDNWSASASSGFLRFGLPFAPGDIPVGSIPEIRLSGTPVTAVQFDERTTWPDGSLRFCAGSANFGTFSGSESKTYTLWAVTGSYTNPGTKSLSDITGATDLKTTFAAVTQHNGTTTVARGSGAFTASLNTHAATATRTWKHTSGPVCEEWWLWGPATDDTGGAADPHLTVEHFPVIWKNTDGTIAAYEYVAAPSQYWWSIASKFRLDYNATLKNAAATLETYAAVVHVYASQWATVRKTADNNYAKPQWIAVTATIPTLLYKPDKDYWVETGLVPPLDTSIVPVASPYSAVYTPCGAINHRANIDATGGYQGRGIMPNSDCIAFLGQTALGFRYARTNALAGLHIPYHFRSNRTRSRPASAQCPGGDATPDTANTVIGWKLEGPGIVPADYDFTADGMPIAVYGSAAFGFGPSSDGYVQLTGGDGPWGVSANSSHAVAYSYFMYLHEPRRYLMQATLDLAVKTAITTNADKFGSFKKIPFEQYPAHVTAFSINTSIQYSGISDMFGSNARKIGWALNLLSGAQVVCPDNDPQRGYTTRFCNHSTDWLTTALNYMPASMVASGSFPSSNTWMNAFICQGAYTYYQRTGHTGMRDVGAFFAKQAIGLYTSHIYRATEYVVQALPDYDGDWAPTTNEYYTADQMPVGHQYCSIDATTDILTLGASPPTCAIIANGDLFRPIKRTPADTIPAELVEAQIYYAVQVSGSTFKLSATQGGAAINFATSYPISLPTIPGIDFSVYSASMNNHTVAQNPPYLPNADSYAPISAAALAIAAHNGNASASALVSKARTFIAPMEDTTFLTWRLVP